MLYQRNTRGQVIRKGERKAVSDQEKIDTQEKISPGTLDYLEKLLTFYSSVCYAD